MKKPTKAAAVTKGAARKPPAEAIRTVTIAGSGASGAGSLKAGMSVTGAGLEPGASIGGVVTGTTRDRGTRPKTRAEREQQAEAVLMRRLEKDLFKLRGILKLRVPTLEGTAMGVHTVSLLALLSEEL